MEPQQSNFFSRRWKIILVVLGILILLILLVLLSSKKIVSPDVAYFPT